MSRVSAAPSASPLAAMPARMVRLEKVGSSDPSQRAVLEGPSQLEFRLAGRAANSGTAASRFEMVFDGHRVSVPLTRGQTPVETLKNVQEKMPGGYAAVLLRTWRHPGADVIVGIRTVPAPVPARVEVQANDPAQQVKMLGKNRFQISGTANNRGIIQSFVKVDVGGRSVLAHLAGGESPADTARKIEAELAKVGFRAVVSVAKRPGGPVNVTVHPRFMPL